MDKIARRVAARWALHEAMGDWQPVMPIWVVPWSDLQIRVAYGKDRIDPMLRVPGFFDPKDTKPNTRNRKQKLYEPSDFMQPNIVENPRLHIMPQRVENPWQGVFDDAKLSIEIMLPSVLKTLGKKFGDRFYMNATQQKNKLYYYFSGQPALETFALTLSTQGGSTLLWLGYIPNKITGGADFKRAMHEAVRVQDPEMTGLALMRLLRKLLSRID